MTSTDVVAVDSLTVADQCRRHAVRTALEHISDHRTDDAMMVLLRSVKTCANLDRRPLDDYDVAARASRLAAELAPVAAPVGPGVLVITEWSHTFRSATAVVALR